MDPLTSSALITAGGAIVGGFVDLFSNSSNNNANRDAARETNRFNAAQGQIARNFNREQVEQQRAFEREQTYVAWLRNQEGSKQQRNFDVQQTNSARAWDRSQVVDQRAYDRQQTLEAESRGRKYLEEDREYSSPTETRKRLEAGGFNPGTASDPSNAVTGTGAFLNSQTGVASSAVARAVAASSGVARSGAASVGAISGVTPTFTASTFGSSLAAAAQSVAQQKNFEVEMALQRTQIAQESARLTEVLQRANQSPVVMGPYARPVDVNRQRSTPQQEDLEDVTTLRIGGRELNPDTGVSDGELFEQRWGEVGGSVAGLGVMMADGWNELGAYARRNSGWLAQRGDSANTVLRSLRQLEREEENWEKDPDAEYYDSFSDPQGAYAPQDPFYNRPY